MKDYVLTPRLNRFVEFFEKDDKRLPPELFANTAEKADAGIIKLPVPCRRSDLRFMIKTDDCVWLGSARGVIRYDENAKFAVDRVMYFAADRDLPDNDVKNIYYDGKILWVLCESGAVSIEMKLLSAEEKAEMLTEETLKYVRRHGMISHKHLEKARDLSSAVSWGHCDNDGGFTAGFVIGEAFRYAYYKKEYGIDDERSKKVRAEAVDALESVLLLLCISGRGDGFPARSFITTDEPLPDDGLFYKKCGDKAVCLDTTSARNRGIAGKEIYAGAKIPDRLRNVYTRDGYTDDDIIYKGDTSSDEITLHFEMLYWADKFLVDDDKELHEIIVDLTEKLITHMIENGLCIRECDGQPTTWAKWNEEYFMTVDGWADSCLNTAELLMCLKVADALCPGDRWAKEYTRLINERGYADYGYLHLDRFNHLSDAFGGTMAGELMYGDNMLCVMSYWLLLTLETDEELLKKYKRAVMTWQHSFTREVTPGYFFTIMSAMPEYPCEEDAIADWFGRFNISRLASGTSTVGRKDVPKRVLRGGYIETGWLLEPDERFISKFDRDPLEYKNTDSGGMFTVEGCYLYTLSYWTGKYFGFIK